MTLGEVVHNEYVLSSSRADNSKSHNLWSVSRVRCWCDAPTHNTSLNTTQHHIIAVLILLILWCCAKWRRRQQRWRWTTTTSTTLLLMIVMMLMTTKRRTDDNHDAMHNDERAKRRAHIVQIWIGICEPCSACINNLHATSCKFNLRVYTFCELNWVQLCVRHINDALSQGAVFRDAESGNVWLYSLSLRVTGLVINYFGGFAAGLVTHFVIISMELSIGRYCQCKGGCSAVFVT